MSILSSSVHPMGCICERGWARPPSLYIVAKSCERRPRQRRFPKAHRRAFVWRPVTRPAKESDQHETQHAADFRVRLCTSTAIRQPPTKRGEAPSQASASSCCGCMGGMVGWVVIPAIGRRHRLHAGLGLASGVPAIRRPWPAQGRAPGKSWVPSGVRMDNASHASRPGDNSRMVRVCVPRPSRALSARRHERHGLSKRNMLRPSRQRETRSVRARLGRTVMAWAQSRRPLARFLPIFAAAGAPSEMACTVGAASIHSHCVRQPQTCAVMR
jgi:hypothetical protein